MASAPALEVVFFRLKDGIDEASFMRANEALMAELRAIDGFVRRELLKDAENRWMDTVYWRSMADAQRAAELFPTMECAQSLMAMLDEASVSMHHFELARRFA